MYMFMHMYMNVIYFYAHVYFLFVFWRTHIHFTLSFKAMYWTSSHTAVIVLDLLSAGLLFFNLLAPEFYI